MYLVCNVEYIWFFVTPSFKTRIIHPQLHSFLVYIPPKSSASFLFSIPNLLVRIF
jgi:hypothetical protein